ncbi:MAG: hypothetical protein ACT4OM_09670 [Actinomycetota bacterium]
MGTFKGKRRSRGPTHGGRGDQRPNDEVTLARLDGSGSNESASTVRSDSEDPGIARRRPGLVPQEGRDEFIRTLELENGCVTPWPAIQGDLLSAEEQPSARLWPSWCPSDSTPHLAEFVGNARVSREQRRKVRNA